MCCSAWPPNLVSWIFSYYTHWVVGKVLGVQYISQKTLVISDFIVIAAFEDLFLSVKGSFPLNSVCQWPSMNTARCMWQVLALQDLFVELSLKDSPWFLPEALKGPKHLLFLRIAQSPDKSCVLAQGSLFCSAQLWILPLGNWHIFKLFMEKIQNGDRVEEFTLKLTLFREKWQRLVSCNAYLSERTIMVNKFSCCWKVSAKQLTYCTQPLKLGMTSVWPDPWSRRCPEESHLCSVF